MLREEFHPQAENNHTNLQKKDDKWLKPPAGYWKINVDAAVRETGDIGLGIIIRDEFGKVIVCRCQKIFSFVVPEAAEGMACQEGIALAGEMGGINLMLETDCKGLYHKLLSQKQDLSSIGEIVNSIRAETRLFNSTSFSWVTRDNNKAAHLLASLALSDDFSSFYTGLFPDRIVLGVPTLERLNF